MIARCIPSATYPEKSKRIDGVMRYVAEWSNGQSSTLSTNPYSIDIVKSSHVTGEFVAGALAGANWELDSDVDTGKAIKDGLASCWNFGPQPAGGPAQGIPVHVLPAG